MSTLRPLSGLGILALVSCGPVDPAGPGSQSSLPAGFSAAGGNLGRISESSIQPDCQAGCQGPGPDPSPEAPGVWVGSDFNDDICLGGSTDLDLDALGDLCELRLIEAFAPEMVYKTRQDGFTEDIGGERYWAARAVTNTATGEPGVLLIYLFAYYDDLGDPPTGSNDHYGDSETIAMVVAYDGDTQHWLLKRAAFSVHTYYLINDSAFLFNAAWPSGYAGGNIEYPAELGGHPGAWISHGKHADYFTRQQCLAGGLLGGDNCDTYQVSGHHRFEVYEAHNLGSDEVRFRDCVNAEFRTGLPRTECFWSTTNRFAGWHYFVVGETTSSPNGARLHDFGFIP